METNRVCSHGWRLCLRFCISCQSSKIPLAYTPPSTHCWGLLKRRGLSGSHCTDHQERCAERTGWETHVRTPNGSFARLWPLPESLTLICICLIVTAPFPLQPLWNWTNAAEKGRGSTPCLLAHFVLEVGHEWEREAICVLLTKHIDQRCSKGGWTSFKVHPYAHFMISEFKLYINRHFPVKASGLYSLVVLMP